MDSTLSSKSTEDIKSDVKYRELESIDLNILKQTDRVVIHTDYKGTEVFLITRSDVVFGFGLNYEGRLGFGHKEEAKEATIIPELCVKSVIDIKCGKGFSVALTQSGEIYTFGCCSNGKTGNGLNNKDYQKPTLITVDNQLAVAIDCTTHRTYVLTQSGQLYWFGCSHWNKCLVLTPTEVVMPLQMKIVAISCGNDHTLALTDDGKVYSWGRNNFGQLGLGYEHNTDTPEVIDLSESIAQVYCGYAHSLLLTTNGCLYSMGNNSLGQLGTGNKNQQNSPKLVLTEEKQTEICCYGNISMSLDVNNKLFVWGDIGNGLVLPVISELTSFQKVVNTYAKYRSTVGPFKLLKPINRVIKAMTKMFDNPKNSDLKFKVKSKESSEFKEIYCHKCYIEETTDYFQTMFANNWSESQTNEILITDYSFEAYYKYLKSLYTDTIECEDFEELLEILSITEQYMDCENKYKCVELIKEKTNLENVCSVYSSGNKYRADSLRQFAFDLMSKNMGKLSQTTDYKNMEPIYAKEFLTEYQQMLINSD